MKLQQQLYKCSARTVHFTTAEEVTRLSDDIIQSMLQRVHDKIIIRSRIAHTFTHCTGARHSTLELQNKTF